MVEWLQFIYAVCTSSEPPAAWREITIAANIAVALAYFWIPIVMAIVFARWREELPYRFLWVGFVVFITACGLSHVVHAFHALTDATPHGWPDLIVLVLTAFVSLVTAAGFTYVLPRILRLTSPSGARKRLEAAVDKATVGLQGALEHERILLLELHHRVKNNLQVVSSLLNMQIRRAPEGQAEDLLALRGRILAMASVHGQLQEVGSTTLDARRFADALAEGLTKVRSGGVSIVASGPGFMVPLDHASSFALILHEVVANALQHGFPAGRGGHVWIELRAEGTARMVRISDDGVGLTGERARGIGHTIVTALATQLGADVVWRVRQGGGTEFMMDYDEARSLKAPDVAMRA